MEGLSLGRVGGAVYLALSVTACYSVNNLSCLRREAMPQRRQCCFFWLLCHLGALWYASHNRLTSTYRAHRIATQLGMLRSSPISKAQCEAPPVG
jgi:hypothetical protein